MKAGNTRPEALPLASPRTCTCQIVGTKCLVQALPNDSFTHNLLPYLLYIMFLDIKLLNEVKSTLNTSLILIKAVNDYAIVTHELRKRAGRRDGGSQMKGCLPANHTIT